MVSRSVPFALATFALGAPALGACPPVPYPPGIDVGAADVTGTIEVDPEGKVVEARLAGPEPLVAAVRAHLDGCTWPGAGIHREVWSFPEPPVRVAGVVRARATRTPVRIALVVGDRTVTTDALGRFAVRNLPPGPAPVRSAEPAWRLPQPLTVEVTSDSRVDLDLWVVPDKPSSDEIVATYRRASDEVGVVRTVGVADAQAIPGTLGDPLRALTAQPGLTRSPYDAGWLLVRGGDFDEVGLYLDGVRVPLVYHLGGFTSVLHPEMVDSVRFWPGMFPARYGTATSGAVDLVPRPVGDQVRIASGANLVFAHAYAEVPTPFGGVAIAARRSYLDAILAQVLDPEAAGIAPRFWDVSTQVQLGPARVLGLTFHDAIDVPSFTGEGTLVIDQSASQIQAVVPLGPVEIRPWMAWTRRVVTGDVTPQQVDDLYPGLRVEVGDELGDADAPSGRWGAGVELQRHTFTIDRDDVVRSAPVWSTDPYVSLSAGQNPRVWTEVRLVTAIVEDEPSQPVRAGLAPRAGATIGLTKALSARLEFGRLLAPPPTTLLLAVAEGAYLPLERSVGASAGGSYAQGGVAFDVDAWVRAFDQLGELELDGSIGEGDGRAAGIETRLRLHHRGLDGSVLYQYARTFHREDPDDTLEPGPFDAPHRLELLGVAHLPRGWVASGRFRWMSGYARIIEPDGYVPQVAYDLLVQETVVLDLAPDDDRLPPFHALDLRIGRTFTFRGWELEVGLDVQNVYSRRVVEPVIAGFGESGPTYGFGLPILPVFAVDGRVFPGPIRWRRERRPAASPDEIGAAAPSPFPGTRVAGSNPVEAFRSGAEEGR